MAQVHQHFFCCRLDMAVDNNRGGQGLVVSEVILYFSCSFCSRVSISWRIGLVVAVNHHWTSVRTCSAAVQVNCDTMPLGPDNPYGEWLTAWYP